MEGFLEANRIVEISLSKLSTIKRSGDLPLRRTLLVSRVLNLAQDVATSAQDSLLSNPHTSLRCSSKLLANFGHNQGSTIDGVPTNHFRTPKPLTRQQSPIALPPPVPVSCISTKVLPEVVLPDEEPMDFENVNSFLGDILQDVESEKELPLPYQDQFDVSSENSGSNRLDSFAVVTHDLEDVTRPTSPGKRNYKQAFVPSVEDLNSAQDTSEDLKRFKSWTAEVSPLESLPGFCGHLSSKNLQTAPFITYMFGRGFTHPSNPDSESCDWPTGLEILDQNLITPPKNTTVAPILAF